MTTTTMAMPDFATMREDIQGIEDLYIGCLCREPEFWLAVVINETDFHSKNVRARTIMKTGIDLMRNGQNPTPVNLARHVHMFESADVEENDRVTFEVIKGLGNFATEEIRMDFLDLQIQVKLEALRRSSIWLLNQGLTDIKTCSPFNLLRIIEQIQANLARLQFYDDNDTNHDLGSILDRLLAGDAAVGKPMATPWTWWNMMSGGGLNAKYLWTIGGAPGKRKTTFIYNLGLWWALKGYRIMHVAVDGGDKFQQGIKYLTLLWEMECLKAGIPRDDFNNVVYTWFNRDRAEKFAFIRPRVVRQLIDPVTYGPLKFQMPADALECYHKAVNVMKTFKNGNEGVGYVRLFDAGDILDEKTLENRLRLEQQVLGIDAFFIDHMGEIDADGRDENARRTAVTRAVVRFKNRYSGRAICLAQRTDAANWDSSEQNKERPGLLNLKPLEQASDLIGITQYTPDNPRTFGVSLFKNREEEHGSDKTAWFDIVPASGLILERRKKDNANQSVSAAA
jgi:hypothetical protein